MGWQMLRLPDEENLGSAEHEADYGRVQVNLDFRRFATVKPKFRGERIGYGITIPANAPHPVEASQFIAFLLGPRGPRRHGGELPPDVRDSAGRRVRAHARGAAGALSSRGDAVSRRSALDVFFGLAGGALLLFLVAPLASTLFSTTPASFWDTLRDPEVLSSIRLTFLAALAAVIFGLLTGVPLAYLTRTAVLPRQAAGAGARQPSPGDPAHRGRRRPADGLRPAGALRAGSSRRSASPSPTPWPASRWRWRSSACRSW